MFSNRIFHLLLFQYQVKENQPNFDQFIEFILVDYVTKNKHGDYIVKNLRGGHLDPHLNFYWRKCDMCNMHYDVIGKAETSKEDLEFIFSKVKSESIKMRHFEKLKIV